MIFLIQSTSFTGNELAIANQSCDTLSTIITDTDLIPRLEPILDKISESVITCNLSVSNKMYFDFVQDFVKYYAHTIADNIVPLLSSIVQRV
jgi:hypothetical protein